MRLLFFPLVVCALLLFPLTSAFFGGDCCCGCDCCCDCCCGCCAPPLLLAVPCCCYGDSYGVYGGALGFGGIGKRRRRKRSEIDVKEEELYAPSGARSADFLNNHRCVEPVWMTLLTRKWAAEGRGAPQPVAEVPQSRKPAPSGRWRRNLAIGLWLKDKESAL